MFKKISWYTNYEVSKLWEVISLNYSQTWNTRILKLWIDKYGYHYINLCYRGSVKNYKVHRLVAQAFISNPENKPMVNHKNWIKTDNRVENLEWTTSSENCRHAYDTWLRSQKLWKHNYKSKTVLQYSQIWDFIKEWWSTMDIKRKLWIDSSSVSHCCHWKYKTAWWFIWKYK